MNERYDFILQFDDDNHSLTSFNGLAINQVGELLESLSKSIQTSNDSKIVLSEVRGNCYALQLSTNSILAFESLKVIHRKIGNSDYSGLSAEARDYASKLKVILGNRYYLNAHDKVANTVQRIENIQLPVFREFYYEIGSEVGVIISIGGTSLDGKTHIRISKVQYEIDINRYQESELINFFKKDRLLLTLKKKLDANSHKVLRAELIEFEVSGSKSFRETANKFRRQFPGAFCEGTECESDELN